MTHAYTEDKLVERLRRALAKLNPCLPDEAIQSAIDQLERDRSAMSIEAANKEIYQLLKEIRKWDTNDQAGRADVRWVNALVGRSVTR
jgi:type I site-specific restriction-modification system R (restriction) subunit